MQEIWATTKQPKSTTTTSQQHPQVTIPVQQQVEITGSNLWTFLRSLTTAQQPKTSTIIQQQRQRIIATLQVLQQESGETIVQQKTASGLWHCYSWLILSNN